VNRLNIYFTKFILIKQRDIMNLNNREYKNHLMLALTILLFSCSPANNSKEVIEQNGSIFTLENSNINIQFNKLLHSRVISKYDNEEKSLTNFTASEFVTLGKNVISDFHYVEHQLNNVNDDIGKGKALTIIGKSTEGLEKRLVATTYEKFPSLALFSVSYKNTTTDLLKLTSWTNNAYQLIDTSVKATKNASSSVPFWSYQGASFEDRRDWLLPISAGFNQQNYMGMNATDYGSGTPISDVWRKDIGLAVGHVEVTPKLVSLPVIYSEKENGVDISVDYDRVVRLKNNESIETFTTFVNVHQKDYYQTLVTYRELMALKGLKAPEYPDSSYEAVWCAWGYERGFNVEEIIGTLPKAKELGLEWAVLDDGWQTAEGDWYLHPEKFPNGDADMQSFVKQINDAGLKAKLWWAPLAVDPGTDLLHEHTDMLLLDKNGAAVDITWWNSFYLCPAFAKTIEHSKGLVKKIMGEWGYSGLKIDGQHLNGVPPCYNPKHNHENPEDSVEGLQDYWKMIYETAQEIDKESVVEICPCGTSYAFHNMPYMNQAVSSDPLTSWQVRLKGKTLKGLMGESSPYYGDHVELSDNANDFASSVGIGAVVGTKFTWPKDKHPELGFTLTPEKEKSWAHWISIYKDKMLPKGIYLGNLYDMGFDKPETHAIAKNKDVYFAFYADQWTGEVEFRGLKKGNYQLLDYVNGKDLGVVMVEDTTAKYTVEFTQYLLVEAKRLD
jgi:alpha-galactosidase